MASRTEILREREWRRCRGKSMQDVGAFTHWAEHHVKIQHPERGAIKFVLRPAQHEIIAIWMVERYSIVLKARQIGWSTLVAAYCLWLAMFWDDQVIVMLSRNQREARKLLKKADYAYKRLPDWMRDRGPKRLTDNMDDMTFANGSSIESLPSKEDPARGAAVSLVVVDEWAFFENAEDAWSSIQPVADVGGRVIGLSTANGWGDFFHQFWVRARTGVSKFIPMFFPWSANSDRSAEWYEAQQQDLEEWQLHQEYPQTEDEAFIKSGRPVFDVDELAKLPVSLPKVGELVVREGVRSLVEQLGGYLEWWDPPSPHGETYVIGADVAEGLVHGDFSSVHVIACKAFEVVAAWHGRIDSDLFGTVLRELGLFYGTALVGVEVNNHGLTTNKALQRLHYPRLYYRHDLDKRTNQRRSSVGWYTSVASKPLMIDELKQSIRQGLKIPCAKTIAELRTYQRDDKGRMMGSPYDDRVVSLAIANQMIKHASAPQYARVDEDYGTFDWMVREDMERDALLERSPIGAHNVRYDGVLV